MAAAATATAALFAAAQNGNLASAKQAVRDGADLKHAGPPGNRTALHWAVLRGWIDIVELLLDSGADVLARDDELRTPFHEACKYGQLLAVGSILIRQTGLLGLTDRMGCTPLHLAAEGGWPEVTKLLLENGADANALNSLHEAPLHAAAALGKSAVVALLLGAGARVNEKSVSGRTPLHEAAESGSEETVKALLKAGADAHAKDLSGETPVEAATDAKIQKLLKKAK
eukprot:TRINITY_DN3747_c0_g1_i1.p3 TRINITY_DN3747_c0_g1~~TRINITY_DN3747_c0_g1_i1.p3  ORF type:complete len:239 (+),score=77.11 TRINITY_DN3747_c0_g1_i1:34-717(+)